MKLIYGYEMNAPVGQIGHIVRPPLLSSKITVSSAGNTTRWVFYGTRQQVLEWIKEHADMTLENTVFVGGGANSSHVHTELVIDLQYVPDQEQGYLDYLKSYFVDIHDVERIKVEIRPRIESKDNITSCLSRVIVASGSRLGDLVEDLEIEWFKPSKSYVQQTVHLFTDTPTPSHVLSAKPPSSIQIALSTTDQAVPTRTVNSALPSEADLTTAAIHAN
ncbi:hypothetical protein EDC96DRAFT_611408 [Choanephora cucurbitarum]|nr:hypothetical protein EDC96DRAFT_611408 [Choanephora cucurbitarum]